MAHHALQHADHGVSITHIQNLIGRFTRHNGRCFIQHFAIGIFDALDKIGRDAEPAIGKSGVTRQHLHSRNRTGAQRHGQVGWVFGSFKTKLGHIVLRVLRRNGLQDAH